MNDVEFRLQLQIGASELDLWVEHGWLAPEPTAGQKRFREADLARGKLIIDLIQNLGLNEEGVDIVMTLIDQLHGVRGALRDLVSAISQEDIVVQRRLLAALDGLHDL